jgi:hypothetical protein
MPRADRVDAGGCAHTGEVMDDRLPPAPARPADVDDDFSGPKLRTDAHQPTWREDAPFRVSSIQTADGSGPVGSTDGLHRHRPDGLAVRSERATVRHWTPSAGRVDITISASRDAGCMTAGWLVGTGQGAFGETDLRHLLEGPIGAQVARRSPVADRHDRDDGARRCVATPHLDGAVGRHPKSATVHRVRGWNA